MLAGRAVGTLVLGPSRGAALAVRCAEREVWPEPAAAAREREGSQPRCPGPVAPSPAVRHRRGRRLARALGQGRARVSKDRNRSRLLRGGGETGPEKQASSRRVKAELEIPGNKGHSHPWMPPATVTAPAEVRQLHGSLGNSREHKSISFHLGNNYR